jgi:hypothetical protein
LFWIADAPALAGAFVFGACRCWVFPADAAELLRPLLQVHWLHRLQEQSIHHIIVIRFRNCIKKGCLF